MHEQDRYIYDKKKKQDIYMDIFMQYNVKKISITTTKKLSKNTTKFYKNLHNDYLN